MKVLYLAPTATTFLFSTAEVLATSSGLISTPEIVEDEETDFSSF
jgi:hypothetical protein